MNRYLVAIAFALVLVASAAASGAVQPVLHARLTPIAPARAGAGTFTAPAVDARGLVTMKWKLSYSNLSGKATRATLRLNGPPAITLVLCKPCRSGQRGRLALLPAVWKRLVSRGAQVVVATRAHPNGELRGKIKTA